MMTKRTTASPLSPLRVPARAGLSLLLGVALLACGDVETDVFRSDGGTAPDPTGVMEGTVLYAGPRPLCDREAGRVLGRVILLLFRDDNPPAPEGTATSAANLLTVPGSLLFTSLDDCMPESPSPEERRMFITRSTDFTWPELPLGRGGPVAYQVRGFYDYDEDFNPFFSVSNLTTAGDVAGGAIVDPTAEVLRFLPIEFGSIEDNEDGQIVGGVSVTLGAPVNTERPIFRLETNPQSSEALLPTTTDVAEAERQLFEGNPSRLVLYDRNPDDPQTSALLRAMGQGGLSIDTSNPFSYAWYVREIDANRDGVGDPHPVLGSQGVGWLTPGVLMERARTEAEILTGVPRALLVPSVRVTTTLTKRVFYPDIEIVIPPVGAMITNGADDRCTIPMIPPGNPTVFYEASTVSCQELPAGLYGINVLHGVAGALPIGGGQPACTGMEGECPAGTACLDGACRVPDALSDTGADVVGGAYSSQAWTIPNPLGDPTQIDDPVPEQGVASLFVVHDPNPDGPVGRRDGRMGCDQAIDPEVMGPRDIVYRDFSEFGDPEDARASCCGPVQHLCDVPLCPPVPLGDTGLTIRGSATMVGEDGLPNCLPFHLPASCCE